MSAAHRSKGSLRWNSSRPLAATFSRPSDSGRRFR
jgi:hypothetical protein